MSGSNSSAPGDASPPPPEPLGLTVHGVAVPDARARNTTSGRLKALLILLACAAPVIASYFTYYVIRPEGRTNYGTLIDPLRPLPAGLPLTSLSGEPVQPESLRDQWLMVVVAAPGCDSACEARLYMQRQLREMLGRERDRVEKVWFVTGEGTVRPELRAPLEQGEVRLLRVPAEALARWLEPAPGQALEAHLYIVDPMGRWMMRMPPNPEPARVKRDLERLLRASSSWDQPGR
jgi:hypothetical protein